MEEPAPERREVANDRRIQAGESADRAAASSEQWIGERDLRARRDELQPFLDGVGRSSMSAAGVREKNQDAERRVLGILSRGWPDARSSACCSGPATT
jgi:hypothetical protein